MAVGIHAPRINNNDDHVKVIALAVAVGDRVARGAVLGQVETDKAIVDVESPTDGFVIGINAEVDQSVAVGSVLLWLGNTVDEPIPAGKARDAEAPRAGVGSPTARARLLLQRHGLSADVVPRAGDRLTAEDVERYVAARNVGGRQGAPAAESVRAVPTPPDVEGTLHELRGDESGVIHTVSWSREFAVPGYIELEYDSDAWNAYAKAYAERHRLLLQPLLALMAWRLVQLAREMPMLNATIVGDRRYQYKPVNLGFTVQAGDTLYLTVLREADALDEVRFVNASGDIQRRAAGHKLKPGEISGATISFSSMARWKVSRHVPVLPPYTSLIVAHATSVSGTSVLGATYDHRALNGFQVAQTLRKLSVPVAINQQEERQA